MPGHFDGKGPKGIDKHQGNRIRYRYSGKLIAIYCRRRWAQSPIVVGWAINITSLLKVAKNLMHFTLKTFCTCFDTSHTCLLYYNSYSHFVDLILILVVFISANCWTIPRTCWAFSWICLKVFKSIEFLSGEFFFSIFI